MNRAAGILLSVTSLPSRYGIGCLDQAAYDFVDFLAEAGQTYWQILPLSPTSSGRSDDSPYQSYSAFAGNPYFISLDALIEEGVLTREECDAADLDGVTGDIDYNALHDRRYPLLRRAYERSNISNDPAYQQFLSENEWWLSDYALFMALKGLFNDAPWDQWPEDIRLRWGYSLEYYYRTLYYDIEFQKYCQFKFAQQWRKLKDYANHRNIQIVGDIPIYVSPDSVDVWAKPELFQLDEQHRPTAISGCPPDAFAADGQIWGNPLYRWDYHRDTGFAWWSSRLYRCFQLYDVVRIDHFRGFDEYFSIPTTAVSALEGHWEKGPGLDLFRTVEWLLGWHPVIAEDLGLMTNTVRDLVRDTGFPNMKVLQFGFDPEDYGAGNDYLPHNFGKNCVAYTGTHDNETIHGWFTGLSAAEKELVRSYLDDHLTPDDEMYHRFVSAVLRTTADTAIIPMQDHLGLDNTARMNTPSTTGSNWHWRMKGGELTEALANSLYAMTLRYGRMNWKNFRGRA